MCVRGITNLWYLFAPVWSEGQPPVGHRGAELVIDRVYVQACLKLSTTQVDPLGQSGSEIYQGFW